MDSYTIFETRAQTQNIWCHCQAGCLSAFDSRSNCIAVALGGGAGFLETGQLERRRAGRNLYHVRWIAAGECAQKLPRAALVIGNDLRWDFRRVGVTSNVLEVVFLSMFKGGQVISQLSALLTTLTLFQLSLSSLFICTQGALSTSPNNSIDAELAGGWNMARAVRQELTSTSVKNVDLMTSQYKALWLPLNGSENEFAQRTHICVPRLKAYRLPTSQVVERNGACSHVVTGGSGALGMITLRWLLHLSNKAVYAVSRGGRLAASLNGVPIVHAFACDMAIVDDVRRMVTRAALHNPGPLAFWHASGVLADGILQRQTASMLRKATAPKAHGAFLLQRSVASVPLQAYVSFSSVAALLGGAGQANYSAANGCLDGLAAARRSAGVTAVSIQWGKFRFC